MRCRPRRVSSPRVRHEAKPPPVVLMRPSKTSDLPCSRRLASLFRGAIRIRVRYQPSLTCDKGWILLAATVATHICLVRVHGFRPSLSHPIVQNALGDLRRSKHAGKPRVAYPAIKRLLIHKSIAMNPTKPLLTPVDAVTERAPGHRNYGFPISC